MAGELEGTTRREFLRLSALTGLAVAVGASEEAEAKLDLPLLTEREFEANVYGAKNPVVVLFYQEGAASKRMEHILEALARQYSDRIDFYRFDMTQFRGGRTDATARNAFLRLTGASDGYTPQTIMYASVDIVTRQQFDRNVKIDVLRGGPTDDKWIESWIHGKGSATDWIESNLTSPNGRYVLRLNNSATPKEINLNIR